MKLKSITLHNFKNYKDLNLVFDKDLNIIIGNNAQGKTNILDAIYYLAITKSFLGINDLNLINYGELYFKLEGLIDTNNKLDIFFNSKEKKLFINDNEVLKHGNYIGYLKVIIFNPDNVSLVKDGPIVRRKFLNIELSQLYNEYLVTLNKFNAILKLRNDYLKNIEYNNINFDYLEILNDKFINLSWIIFKYRLNFINEINKYLENIFFELSSFKSIYIKYNSLCDENDENKYKNVLSAKLKESLKRDLLFGNTYYGPHKDDFLFLLNDKDISLSGSTGQIKLAVLSLKLAEIQVFKNLTGDYPIILLDDLFSEIDIDKRNKILKYLNSDIQIFISTTDVENINTDLIKNANIIKIENGKIIK